MTVRALITAGPTREPLDAVRYISNASTGRQGACLAQEAVARGWVVYLVHGPMEVEVPRGTIPHSVQTAAEMMAACRELHPSCDVVIGAAAVSDYRPIESRVGKRKKDSRPWMIQLVPTEDILADLGKKKGERIHAGFALETDDLLENARRKFREKKLDFLVANPASAIGAPESEYVLIAPGEQVHDLGRLTKRDLAVTLLDAIEVELRYRHPER